MTDARPNILYLVHRFPYPPDKGDRIRAYHLIRFLHERANLHVASLADEPVDPAHRAALAGLCERLEVVKLRRGARWVRAVKSLAGGKTATEGAFRSRRFFAAVRRLTRATRFDAVVISGSSMGPYVRLPELQRVPLVADLVDVDSEKWFQYAAAVEGAKRWLYLREGRRVRRLERRLLERSRAVTLVSEEEAALFRLAAGLERLEDDTDDGRVDRTQCVSDRSRLLPRRRQWLPPTGVSAALAARVHAIPNGVDLEYFSPGWGAGCPGGDDSARSRTGQASVVFLGAMDYPPNVDAVTWFAREVWPLVRHEAKSAPDGGARLAAGASALRLRECSMPSFTIVGRRPAPAVERLRAVPGVHVTGAVPDVRPYLAAASIVVAPLRIARGIQNKVLEAMAMGCPVVATPEALSGLQVQPGVHVLEVATPGEWAAAVKRLLANPELRRQLAVAGRRYVEEHHHWNVQLSPLSELLSLPAPSAEPQTPAATRLEIDPPSHASRPALTRA